MIIEDDPDVRDLIDIVLTQSGFRTIVAKDGPDGVEAVRQHDPLLTTLDVNMPGMDGFAVAKRLREFSNTYLIMITALADEIDVVQGFEAGADDYLVKPFRPRELRARADSMLRRPRTRNEVPTSWASAPAVVEPDPEPVVELSWAAQAARDLGQGSRLTSLSGAQVPPPGSRTERRPGHAGGSRTARSSRAGPGTGSASRRRSRFRPRCRAPVARVGPARRRTPRRRSARTAGSASPTSRSTSRPGSWCSRALRSR